MASGGVLTAQKRNLKLFNGENYLMWKFRLLEIIEQEGASKVLYEDPPTPIIEEWIKWERFARGTLIEYLDDTIISQVPPGRATARQILEKFDGLYACKKVSTQLCLQDRLFNCKLKPAALFLTCFAVARIRVNANGVFANTIYNRYSRLHFAYVQERN